jgi:membrane-bound lytic murein transglycosylase D
MKRAFMKKNKIFLITFLCVFLVIIIDSCASIKQKRPIIESMENDQKVVVQEPSGSLIGSELTISPDIPDEVEFCGKKIDLGRYDLRERYDREMLSMLYMQSSTLMLIKRANRYFPVIEPILATNGVPDDFKYLACIESHLDYRAVSSARAVGMWQFIPETAREYGLVVNDEVDERYNIVKSTEAACRYLKYAYSLYGDWATAAASYNTGYVRISNELIRQRANNGLDLWLVDETMRYVFRIITCKEFLKDPKKYGFYIKKELLYPPFVTKDTLITGKVSNWINLADTLGVSFFDLKSFNTWIRSDSLVNAEGNSYKVTIPVPESRFYNKKNIPVHQKNWVTDAD